jgi:hypothetical protein
MVVFLFMRKMGMVMELLNIIKDGAADTIKKGVGLAIMGAIFFASQSWTSGQKADAKGMEAFERVTKVEPQIDSMQKTCVKERQENALFKQEIRQELKYYKEGQDEMKGDIKELLKRK